MDKEDTEKETIKKKIFSKELLKSNMEMEGMFSQVDVHSIRFKIIEPANETDMEEKHVKLQDKVRAFDRKLCELEMICQAIERSTEKLKIKYDSMNNTENVTRKQVIATKVAVTKRTRELKILRVQHMLVKMKAKHHEKMVGDLDKELDAQAQEISKEKSR
ncbi:hypothetical protein Ciccas_007617 [Cichlidogyrus casuarinus]|uniref:Uncharacterized protein n=1 Tax=Cichlidogyrus casuarinus TaxID=1844966 RepID=A0ABD2Q2E1_9PLAT